MTSNTRMTFVRCGSLLAAVVCVAACVDTTPVTVEPADAAAAAEAAAASPCLECLGEPDDPGPGCATEVAACNGYPACAKSYACVAAKGCFGLGALGAIENCGIPCAQQAGILSSSGDPAFNAAYAVFQCAASGCGGACTGAGADGGS